MTCPNGHESASSDYCDTCGSVMDASAAAEAPAAAAGPAPDATPDPAVDSAPAGDATCPHCGAVNPPNPLFCEACGYDFTTNTPPRAADADPFSLPEDDAAAAAAGGPAPVSAPVEGAPADAGSDAAPAPASVQPAAPAPPPSPAPSAGASPADNPSPVLDPPWVAEVWIDPRWYASQASPDPLPSAGPPQVVPLRRSSLLIGRVSQSRGIHPDIDCGADNGVSRRHAQLTTDGARWWVEDLDSANGTYLGDALGTVPTTPIPTGQKREIGPDDRVYLGSWTRVVIRPAADGEV